MHRLGLALTLAALAAAAPAHALDLPPLCQALHSLADEARTGGQPLRISASVDLGAPGDCRPLTDTAATKAFCAAAAQADGLAWRVYDCQNNLSSGLQVSTRAEHAERRFRKAITRLTVSLGHGARFDLSENAGRYDIVVWAAK